jgi:valyl-tRNA synthetase
MPPPNVTGTLHMGHAVMLAIEDILIRYHRMRGERTLWVPGADHAAIATQTKVEKELRDEGTDRHKLGRVEFLKRVNKFALDNHDFIVNQIKKMGSSCDWSREAYTLDETRTKAVRAVFKMMYDDGLIYRGERIVNWCPRCRSTLADDEVEHKEQKAKLYTFKYSKDFPFAIATTRPETKLGDTAVAVNPRDSRYEKYIGKIYEVDFCGVPLKLKIVADREVDMEFGTGALGVTPAHSATDWRMAEENKLEIIKVIDECGQIREGFGEFSGKSVMEARKEIVKKLKENGLLQKEEEIDNNLSLCYRCDTPIEPLPSLQWFINVNKKIPKYNKSIKELSIEAVKKGIFGRDKIRIIPERFEKNYFHWMENLRDWCISRQIWFGHRVPVWYCGGRDKGKCLPKCKNPIVSVDDPKECPCCGSNDLIQDEDTLDTWFSSGLWTFSTLAQKPDQIKIKNGKLVIDSDDFKNFHPTAVLETGYDILFFWIARMIIMTTYAVGDIPFRDVYLHGLVRDEKGRKMSKSLGNVIDPLDMIKKYGTDATRLSLVIGTTPGNDINLSEAKVAGFRNFANKLWNISRFIIGNHKSQITNHKFNEKKLTEADKWILDKMGNLVDEITSDLNNYSFSQAGEKLREFTWNDFADWYLEVSKFEKNEEKDKILVYVLETLLKLWHPFMPFVTEKIWEELGNDKMLMIEKWPEKITPRTPLIRGAIIKVPADIGVGGIKNFELIKNIIIAIRNARAEHKVPPSKKVKAVIYAGKHKELIKSQVELIKNLRTQISDLEIKNQGHRIKDAIHTTVDEIEVYLIGAIDKEKEKERIKKEIENLEKVIKNAKIKLENKEFVAKAPEKVVNMEKEKLEKAERELEKLKGK